MFNHCHNFCVYLPHPAIPSQLATEINRKKTYEGFLASEQQQQNEVSSSTIQQQIKKVAGLVGRPTLKPNHVLGRRKSRRCS
jgi:hypothetical protein